MRARSRCGTQRAQQLVPPPSQPSPPTPSLQSLPSPSLFAFLKAYFRDDPKLFTDTMRDASSAAVGQIEPSRFKRNWAPELNEPASQNRTKKGDFIQITSSSSLFLVLERAREIEEKHRKSLNSPFSDSPLKKGEFCRFRCSDTFGDERMTWVIHSNNLCI